MLLIIVESFAQTTTIWGKVTDNETGKPIPFVHLVFKNTFVGTSTDTLGKYKLTTKKVVDSVLVSSVTYLSKTFRVSLGKSTEDLRDNSRT